MLIPVDFLRVSSVLVEKITGFDIRDNIIQISGNGFMVQCKIGTNTLSCKSLIPDNSSDTPITELQRVIPLLEKINPAILQFNGKEVHFRIAGKAAGITSDFPESNFKLHYLRQFVSAINSDNAVCHIDKKSMSCITKTGFIKVAQVGIDKMDGAVIINNTMPIKTDIKCVDKKIIIILPGQRIRCTNVSPDVFKNVIEVIE
jgi:hypothetical protein